MTQFSAVAHAMSVRRAMHEVGAQPGRIRPLGERLAWQRAREAAESAYRAVASAYAAELLPALLGGEWRTSDRVLKGRAFLFRPYREHAAAGCHALFDHPLHFRRCGTRGPLTWRNGALLGQPYDVFGKDGALRDMAMADAAEFARRHGVGVWARRDLSAWYPGWTALVVAALDLCPDDAARFGFVALAPLPVSADVVSSAVREPAA